MRVLGFLIHSSQDCRIASLNGLLTHLSIGCANDVQPPGIRTTSALQSVLTSLMLSLLWCGLYWSTMRSRQWSFFPNIDQSHYLYSSFVCHPFVVARTRILSGMLSAHRTRSPRTPPFSLKKITGGSFSPAAVAVRATVKPFCSAFVVFILMSFWPLTLLVLPLGMSKRTIVWSMLMMSGGSIL